MIPTLLASQNQRYGSPICSLIPISSVPGPALPFCVRAMRNEPRNGERTCRWKPDRTKKSLGWRVGASDKKCCGGWGARGQFLHAYSRFALFAPGPRRNIRKKLSVLDSLMRAQSLFAPMADRRPGSSYESDNVPFTRTTIGQKLKALYQVPRDLPQECLRS